MLAIMWRLALGTAEDCVIVQSKDKKLEQREACAWWQLKGRECTFQREQLKATGEEMKTGKDYPPLNYKGSPQADTTVGLSCS